VREKYCWLVADKPSEQCLRVRTRNQTQNAGCAGTVGPRVLLWLLYSCLEMAMAARNPITRWVLPDKEAGVEGYLYPRVR
jgi:hypothetical protein